MAHYRSTRSSRPLTSVRPFVGFLLVASFGILFAGCGGEEVPKGDEVTFTAEDLAKVKELVGTGAAETGTGETADVPRLELAPENEEESAPPVVDVTALKEYDAIRAVQDTGKDVFRVTNAFLNVRSEPTVTSAQVDRLEKGDTVELVEFVDAAWAKVTLESGDEGYVSGRYISKLVSETQLTEEKKKYDGLFFVDFGFLNVRKESDTASEKLGELPGQAFVRPLSTDDVWARIPFEGGDGYVAVQYLSPFQPNYLVRQSTFHMPLLHYKLDAEGVLGKLPDHIRAFRDAGFDFSTLRDFHTLLARQEERDVRLDPKTAVIVVTGITPENVQELSDTLRGAGVGATLFLETQYVGTAIDQKMILRLLANGNDLQSAGHTGDDLRSLTNAQVELELGQSKKLLEQLTKRKVFAVAYPLGGVNDRVARKAAETGYLLGVSTTADHTFERTQLLRIPSLVITSDTTSSGLLERAGHSNE